MRCMGGGVFTFQTPRHRRYIAVSVPLTHQVKNPKTTQNPIQHIPQMCLFFMLIYSKPSSTKPHSKANSTQFIASQKSIISPLKTPTNPITKPIFRTQPKSHPITPFPTPHQSPSKPHKTYENPISQPISTELPYFTLNKIFPKPKQIA